MLAASCGENPDEFEPWPDGAQFYVGSTLPDTALAFSPGGNILLFCSANSGNPGIYGYDAPSSPSLRTFAEYDEFTGPTGCWSDTTGGGTGKIVYSAVHDDGSGEIRWIPGNEYQVNLLLYDSLPNMHPTWSPAVDSVVYASMRDSHWGLWKTAVDSVAPFELFCPGEDCVRPSYSPSGDWILFQRMDGDDWDVWIVRPDGTDPHAVVSGSSDDMHPTWAPSGGWFAFASDRTGNFEIWVGSVESDSLTQVTDDPAADIYPAWNPESDWLAFSADRVGASGDFDIFWIPAPFTP